MNWVEALKSCKVGRAQMCTSKCSVRSLVEPLRECGLLPLSIQSGSVFRGGALSMNYAPECQKPIFRFKRFAITFIAARTAQPSRCPTIRARSGRRFR